MSRIAQWCLLGLCAGGVLPIAAEDASGTPPLIAGKDELQVNLSLGGRYDSNPEASAGSGQAEYDASAGAGSTVVSTLDALDRLALAGNIQAMESNRDADRREILGGALLRFNRIEEIDSLVADGQWSRTDDPNALTGQRVVADAYRGDARYEWNDERDRYGIFADAGYNRFLNGVAGVPAAAMDSTAYDIGFAYGRKISEFDLLTLRLTGTLTIYTSTAVSQDNDGVSLMGGWASQLSEQDTCSVEAGVEAKHYDADAAGPSYDALSPTVQVSLQRPWAGQGQLTAVVRENLATSLYGNPALVGTASIDATYPLAAGWTARAGCSVSQVRDIHSAHGQPEDLRTTEQARLGAGWRPLSGLSIEAGALYEVSDDHLVGEYRRIGGQATLTQTF